MLNVSATQELSKQIELLKAENAKLKTENSNYESRLTKIEALLNVGQTLPTGK
jgi:FtsZ-binding cell division protein ZapB